MPVYCYECPCGERIEEFRKMDDRNTPALCACGREAPRGFERAVGHGDLEPYFDEHLCAAHSPTGNWVRSNRERRDLLKRFGLAEAYGKGWM